MRNLAHQWVGIICDHSWNVNTTSIKSKCDHSDSRGPKPPSKYFWNYIWVSAALDGGPRHKVCTFSSGRHFLILSGCWLLVSLCILEEIRQSWCVSGLLFHWITCDSQSDKVPRAAETQQNVSDEAKHAAAASLIAFVSPVQMSRVMVRVWAFIWWWFGAVLLTPQHRRTFSLFGLFQNPAVGDIERSPVLFISGWGAVVVPWTWCDFAGPFVWLPAPPRPKVFPPAGFLLTRRFGTHSILKMLFVISR